MHTTVLDSITLKTRELCQTILDDESYAEIRKNLDIFINDEQTQALYQNVSQMGSALQRRHSSGEQVSDKEIAAFESSRDTLLANPIASNFMESQREMHRIQETVMQYVQKTYELGRMPELADFEKEEGCCGGSNGGGCGCD